MRYLGRWYEVASLKQGFAGEGQQDCHCTQGVYVPRTGPNGEIKLEVNTFCFHGGSTGRLSGIRGDVTCANPRDLYLLPEYKTELEREEMVKEKCVLRFPQIPFIPPETYDVIRTDYENYAIVQGSADKSFVQIYSRTPNPGKAFIEKQKKLLAKFGYPIDKIKDTPQDCNVIPDSTLSEMMGSQMMDTMFTNTAPESEIEAGVRFEGPRNLLQSFKDLINIANCSRVYLSLKEFTESTLEGIRCRALGLLNDLRASRVTLQCLGRIEAIDCVCQETLRATSVITPLHEDAARRVTEQLRRRVQQYRTTIGEEYRTLVPTNREAFEKGFDNFVNQCLLIHNSNKQKTDHWFRDLVSSGAIESDLRYVYIHFQKQLRDACVAQSKCPLPPPLFRMESAHSPSHRRCKTEPEISKSVCRRPTTSQSMSTEGRRPWHSEDLPEQDPNGEARLHAFDLQQSTAARERLEIAPKFLTPYTGTKELHRVQMTSIKMQASDGIADENQSRGINATKDVSLNCIGTVRRKGTSKSVSFA
eukprot:g1293.t1